MPTTRNYKSGAIIYFEGDKSDEIYVLKAGVITLTYRGIDTMALVSERLKNGDFFGVKSAIGRFKREETAQVNGDVTILVLTVKEFEDLATKNIRIVVKMLKIFSTQLRKIGKQAATLLSSSVGTSDSSVSLMKTGEYFLKNKKFDHALYAFHKYIEHYSNGEFVERAKENIQLAQKGVSSSFKTDENDQTDSLDSSPSEPQEEESQVITLIEESEELISENKYQEALEKLSQIDTETLKSSNKTLYEKVSFNISRCHFEIEDYQKAVDMFTNLIKENPKTEKMKTILLFIGKSYQSLGDIGKASNFYKKVSGMPPQESINDDAKKFLEEIEN